MAKAAKDDPVYALTEKTPDHVRKIYRHLRSGHPHIQVRPKDQAAGPPGGDDGYSSSDACVEARAPKHRRDKRGRRRNVPSDFYSMYEEDDLVRMPMWKSYLYHLQQQAPKPKKIVCQREVANKPPFYGREFHGAMSREDADFLLTIGGEGSFLIRESQRAPGQYTLAIRFQDVTKNFKLYYDGQHYVGEKRFDNVQDLVADGLITFYLESKAADYIAALSAESNYAESPYVAYNTFKKRQLAHPSRRTRSRHAHANAKPQPVPGPSGVAAAVPSAVGQTSRSGSSGRESGRESGNSSSGSGGVAGATPVVGGAAAVAPPSAAVSRSSRANIPVSSQFVEKRRSQAETSQQVTSTPQGAAAAAATATPAIAPTTQAEPRPTSQTPLSKHSQATNAAASATYQQVIVVTQAPIAAPTSVSASNVNANLNVAAASSQPYYQNSEQIALYQQQLQQQKQKQQQQQGDGSLQCQIPPPPDEPAPRPPIAGPSHGPPTTMAPTAPPSVAQPPNIPAATSVEPVVTMAMAAAAQVTDNGISGVDGKVSHSTNTEGPPKPPLPTPLPEIRPKRHSAAPLSRQSSSRSPSPRAKVRDSKKTHSFKMFENFSTPPGSPPPHPHLGGEIKLSSVSWCTDYLEVMGCEKPHNFKLHTFKGPHWCDYCANFLWGLIAQGVKCQDCGLNAHKKCSERVPNDCMPDMKYVKRMFGIDLTTLVKAQNTLIPAVVEMCVKEIESRGLDAEGLYRVAGFHDDVEAIKMLFDKDIEQTDITEDSYDDINTITSVLKLYFRLLPIPLVTFEIYFRVIDTVRREDINLDLKLDKLKHMLAQLPPAHYHTLKYLMSHLHRVTEQQSKNMMNAENLAIVFAPTALRSPETDPLSSLTAVKYERELIEVMIHHHTTLFD